MRIQGGGSYDEDGVWVTELPPKSVEFMEWLLDPNRVGSEAQWCKDNDRSVSSKERWKKNIHWRKEFERRAAELNVSPMKIQQVVEALHQNAARGDVRSAELYLRYADRLKPQQVVLVDRGVADLSDEELDARLAALSKAG